MDGYNQHGMMFSIDACNKVVVFAACGYRPPGRGPAKRPFQTLKNLAPSRASGADEDL